MRTLICYAPSKKEAIYLSALKTIDQNNIAVDFVSKFAHT